MTRYDSMYHALSGKADASIHFSGIQSVLAYLKTSPDNPIFLTNG